MFNIILIEDNEDDALLVKIAFQDLRIPTNILVANKGSEALALFQDIEDKKTKIDLILLDINLPGMNGLEILKHIKENMFTKKIPVAVFSSTDLESDILMSHQLGGDFFIRKPNNIHGYKEIAKQISEFLVRC